MLEFSSAAEMLAHYAAVRKRLWSAAPKHQKPQPPVEAPPPSPEPPAALNALDPTLPRILFKRITGQRWPIYRSQLPPGHAGEVMCSVCALYGFSAAELKSKQRVRVTPYNPRHVAMLLLREYTRLSLPKIGRIFSRDHSTVVWAIQNIWDRLPHDGELLAEIEFLRRAVSRPDGPERATLRKLCGERE